MLQSNLAIIVKLDHSEGRVLLGLNFEALFLAVRNSRDGASHLTSLVWHWGLRSVRRFVCLIWKPALFFVLFCPADKTDGHLGVRWDDTLQRFGRKHTVCELFANFCWWNKCLTFISMVLIQVSKSLHELEFEWRWLRSIVYQKGWVISAFTHINGSKIQRALLTATFFEDNWKLLLDASCCYFDQRLLVLAFNGNKNIFRDNFCSISV